MTNTRRIAAVVMGLAGIAGGLAGCVSQGEYDRAAETANSALARQAELARERDEAQKSLDAVRGRITQSETTISELSSKNSQLQSQLDAALAEYKNLEARMQGFVHHPSGAGTQGFFVCIRLAEGTDFAGHVLAGCIACGTPHEAQ